MNLNRTLLLGCLFILSGCGAQSGSSSSITPPESYPPIPPPSTSEPVGCALTEGDQAMLEAVNAARGSSRSCGGKHYAAAPALNWSCSLTAAARQHSRDMATHGFLSHTGSNGLQLSDRVGAAGYAWRAIGENVAAGQRSVDAVMQSWLQSPGHCANIMNPDYRDMGAASAASDSSSYSVYWTQVFGLRAYFSRSHALRLARSPL